MISTPTAVAATQYTAFIHNCLRNASCEPSWSAPLPGVPYTQLYVDFGIYKPVMVEFQLINACTGAQEQIFPSNYVVGQTPDGNWYGVFKYFNSPVTPVTTFVVWLSATVTTPAGIQERTFFSEMLMDEPCAPLTKVKSCHPEGATTTGFDINGVYYGLPENEDFLGMGLIRYFHIAYVRLGKVRELSNKATFKSSLLANFRSTIEKIHQLETELVPKWYKDELLAIYSRGAIQVNDGQPFIVSDINFEALNDDDLTWKPFAQLKETFRLFYGCDASECIECCTPQIISATVTSEDAPSESGSESASASEPPPEEFLVEVQSGFDQDGNEITSVSPAFFTIMDGSFPIVGIGSVKGNHSGFTGVISVTVVKPVGVTNATLRLIVNGSLVECIQLVGSGGASFASTTINPGDTVLILYFDDVCL